MVREKLFSEMASSSSYTEVESMSTGSFIGSTNGDYMGVDFPQKI